MNLEVTVIRGEIYLRYPDETPDKAFALCSLEDAAEVITAIAVAAGLMLKAKYEFSSDT